MKKLFKILTAVALTVVLCSCLLTACAGHGGHDHIDENCDGKCDICEQDISIDDKENDDDKNAVMRINDNYDNYYEIFVYSFNDSDGDGIGDLQGVTEKLDYVYEMGYTGIWLMPICPSPSYHKYNITDYKAIDEVYGSMEDFEELVEAAHSLGIKIIIDMVLNHSSASHPWFQAALKAFTDGDIQSPFYDYYTFSNKAQSGYRAYGEGIYAEAYFDQDMPDLNLDSDGVRAEIEDIIDFWIKEKDVDGFRLDAVRYFYTGNAVKSAEFTGWIKERADAAIREARGDNSVSAFIVGEDWSTDAELQTFYQYGKGTSFFDFQVQGSSGYIGKTIETAMTSLDASGGANIFFNSLGTVISKARGYIASPFLGNHDLGRIAGELGKDETKIKFAYGLLSLYSGSMFAYYGDEIGMTGSANDPEKRVGMLWTRDTEGIYPPGASKDSSRYYSFPSVTEQLADETSILNYYKMCNNSRITFPSLMRGISTRIENENENILVFTKTYKSETITIVVNFSGSTETVTGIIGEIKQSILVDGTLKGTASSLQIPAYGIVILQ